MGRVVTARDYDLLVCGDIDVYKPNGTRLLSLRRGIFTESDAEAARDALRWVSKSGSLNRGMAAGGNTRQRKLADGTVSRTMETAERVESVVVGFLDRTPRFPFCRQTVRTGELGERFATTRPILEKVRDAFRDAVPDRYEVQNALVRKTSPDFVIPGTPWTTITVNRNWDTRLHTDKGDLDEGFSTLTVLRKGSYGGGVLVFPAFRVGADLHTGDVAFMDAHELHGNTPFENPSDDYERISMVLYYRTKMKDCGSIQEELVRAKNLRGSLLEGSDESDE